MKMLWMKKETTSTNVLLMFLYIYSFKLCQRLTGVVCILNKKWKLNTVGCVI